MRANDHFCLKALYGIHGTNEGNFEAPKKKKVSKYEHGKPY